LVFLDLPVSFKNKAKEEVFMRRITLTVIGLFLTIALSGCASVEIGGEVGGRGGGGGTYYNPKPHLPVSTNADSVTATTVAVLPK
jgi:uncharacterized protein YceK